MSEEIKVVQNSVLGYDTKQIAEQNNYYSGMSPEQAAELTIKLFLENFPKLREEAMIEARKRAEELCKEIFEKLKEQDKVQYSAFVDPYVQFALNRAQQEYARFGTDELRDLLSNIIVNRINYNDDEYMKIIFDEAIEVAKLLKDIHLNYLSLIFLCKQVKFNHIDTIEKLKEHCLYICSKLPVPNDVIKSIPFLNVNRLLILLLGGPEDFYSNHYSFRKEEIKEILPAMMNSIHGNYGLSPIGIVIAIININKKTNFKLDFKIWLTQY